MPKNRGIYLLPNLFTSGSLFAAFYAIIMAMGRHFEPSVIAVFVSMVADMFDGRVARITNTQSEFGAQYDSLADMVAFGVTPAVIVYSWALRPLGNLGWLVAFFYTASVALRLARFNVQRGGHRYFVGLPCPAAAGWLCGLVWFLLPWVHQGQGIAWVMAAIMVLGAALMVSNLPFYSFKEIDFKGRVPFVVVVCVALMFVLIAVNPSMVLFLGFCVYALSGPVLALRRVRAKRHKETQHSQVP